ncbi:MAG: sulfotransferase family protein [Nannocystaceae bacterium]|nr:sulfotransferase [bacterium]
MSAAGIVVLGTPRSGTTLLRRLLDAHPNIACPPETYVLSGAARFLHEETFAQGLQIGALFGLGYAGFDEAEVLGRLRRFAFGFFEEHAAKAGKGRWAEKTAFDAFHVDAIRRLCSGHVKFVCLHRHGLDVAASLAELVDKTGGFVEELHRYVTRYPQPLEAYAHAWVDTAGAIEELAQSEGGEALSIRYEDLARDPEAVLRDVLTFVGEPWDEGIVERGLGEASAVGFGDWKTYARAKVDTKSVARWKSLPRATQTMLAAVCNPTLERLGYEPVATEDEVDEDARRRYELGLLLGRLKKEE